LLAPETQKRARIVEQEELTIAMSTL